ncbi:response regulator [Thermoanaerobacterium sp. RBIITD]|uniref:response regulator n=1 Tax=Thermoanaerobacterium sp. RBIITD TaxID=1550240 RepID=UPI000BB7160F|nr:response regulator [Thermoanaerobacterium sp. RBIITD]SNX53732.1 Response regulator receiver domain-containing protein [Thermoanaerobacterium sp. RBIITD]
MEERRDSKSILIVDDTALIRLMVKDILGAEGYDVETAATAEEAILKIKSSKKELFDLVIVDINLPNQNGFEFIQKLKSHSEYKNIPVMILSGDATASSITQAIEIGAVEYLIKPFKAVELVKRVVKLIGYTTKKDRYPELKKLLKSEINRAKRSNVNLSLVLAQCEGKISAGISKIAEQVRHKIRDIDTVFEIDDSNLALILPITGAAGVAIVIKKIKDKLPGKWYFGVATYSDNGKDEQELINFAREDLMKKISDLKQETIETK